MTKTLKFKCTLESDLVLSQTSSSEGNQKTLDFIPGNNFLGIVASKLYKGGSAESLELFHSGKVRFGDAHPSVDGIRGLKVPASMYYPKLGSAGTECYIRDSTHLVKRQVSLLMSKRVLPSNQPMIVINVVARIVRCLAMSLYQKGWLCFLRWNQI